MQSLLVILAAVSAACAAYHPMVINHDVPTTTTTTHAYTSSELLKALLDEQHELPQMVPAVDLMTALTTLGLTEAKKIAIQIDLERLLRDAGYDKVTLFLPSDNALIKWREQYPDVATDVNSLTKLFLAGIVPRPIMSSDLTDEKIELSMSGVNLRCNIYNIFRDAAFKKITTLNGAPIIEEDRVFKNVGIIHVVDKVVYPLPDGNIFDVIAQVPRYSVLVYLVQQAGLEETLRTMDGLTLLAPVDEAFEALSPKLMMELAANKTKLRNLLEYHVIKGTRYSAGFVDGQRIDAMMGGKIRINIENGQIIFNKSDDNLNHATALHIDIPTTTGVIYVIDKVLTPPQTCFN